MYVSLNLNKCYCKTVPCYLFISIIQYSSVKTHYFSINVLKSFPINTILAQFDFFHQCYNYLMASSCFCFSASALSDWLFPWLLLLVMLAVLPSP